METVQVYAAALIAFGAYLIMVAVGRKSGVWKRIGVTFYGPVMMIRTTRGRGTIDWMASKTHLWRAYGTASAVVTVMAMVFLTGLILLATLMTLNGHGISTPSARIGTASDPLTVIAYVVIGASLAILVHEFLHGVLSVVGKIKIDSLGLLVLLIPIGAFVEPNDKELRSATRPGRIRIFAAGPAANLILAFTLMILLVGVLAPSARPFQEGAVVTDVGKDSPAAVSGMNVWSEITGVAGQPIRSVRDFQTLSIDDPGQLTNINLTYRGHHFVQALPAGMAVVSETDGPALNAGIRSGMIVRSIDDRIIHSASELASVVENASRDRPVNVTVLKLGYDSAAGVSWFVPDDSVRTVNLTSKWLYYYLHYPTLNKESYRNVSFLGISVSPFGLEVGDPEEIVQPVSHPFAGAHGLEGYVGASFRYVALPFNGYSPMTPPLADLYGPSGTFSFMPTDVYWMTVNLVYWVFWVNLMLGLSNALPVMPMDGALVLRDLIRGLVYRINLRLTGFDLAIGQKPVSDKGINALSAAITVLVSGMIVYLLLWQMLGPF
jgi:membrane-associated protease RseP (regulator of RpoE activity)